MPTKSKKKPRPQVRTAKRSAARKTTARRKGKFPIVGIGASAGGLAAIIELLQALPADPGMAFVVISHMDPGHESMLDALLAKKSKMPVQQATNRTAVKPDHVYVIQPGQYVTLKRGVLRSTVRGPRGPLPTTIDHFFASLAADRRTNARGVVLSGIGSDGTQGLKLIRAHGGITFAQDPHSAQFDSMPTSAIHAGHVDFVLAPNKIGAQLMQVEQAPQRAAELADALVEKDRDFFTEILSALFQSSGVDFSQYKLSTLRRRIARRMNLKRLSNLAAYANYLRNHPDE